MPKQMKYNPAFLSDEDLVRGFVVRDADLHTIIDIITDNSDAASPQHTLVVGPRGIGKTTLLLRAMAEVRAKPELNAHWHPLVFGEEAYAVSSPGEFWLEALFHLGEQEHDSHWQNAHRELSKERDETRLRDRALARLMDFADEHQKKILLVVENLNSLFGEQISEEDAWVLRHTLLNEPRLMLLASATSRFKEIDNSDQALYDLFRVIELSPLNDDECRAFFKSITGNELAGERIRPTKILTGGNPRLLAIIAAFAARSSFTELMSNLIQLVDDHTDYFKSHLDCLPPQERKVFVALADLWDPGEASKVAAAARLPVNKTSSYLLRLVDKGAVVVVDQQKGKKTYQIAERMYNIYHLMRRRGKPSSRVQAVVNFMIHFYKAEELAQKVTEEAMQLTPGHRVDHFEALEAILGCTASLDLKHNILSMTFANLAESPDIPPSLRELLVQYCNDAIDSSQYKESAFISTTDFASLVADIRRRIMQVPDDAIALLIMANKLKESPDDVQQAEKAFRKTLEIAPDFGLAWLFFAYFLFEHSDRLDEMESAYKKAMELNPDELAAFHGWALFLNAKTNRYVEAEQAYRKAIEIDPNSASLWATLGTLLNSELERYAEAEQACRKAIELDPQYAPAWAQLGELLHEKLERHKEAEEAYRRVIELEPHTMRGWHKLGELLSGKMGRYDEAEQIYRKALEINPRNSTTYMRLGMLLSFNLNRHTEAEQVYRKCIELEPENAAAYSLLGLLLHTFLGRYIEAEEAYRSSLNMNPRSPIWKVYIELLVVELERPSDALMAAEDCLSRTDRSIDSLNNLSLAFYNSMPQEYISSAESWAREAMKKAPENAQYKLTLALVLSRQRKWQECLDIMARVLSSPEVVSPSMSDIIDLYIGSAASSFGAEALEQLVNSDSAGILEPLICGLRMFLGIKVKPAQEIKEIAKDIVKRIRKEQESK